MQTTFAVRQTMENRKLHIFKEINAENHIQTVFSVDLDPIVNDEDFKIIDEWTSEFDVCNIQKNTDEVELKTNDKLRCNMVSCRLLACCNTTQSIVPIRCVLHRTDDMIKVTDFAKCNHPDCLRVGIYSVGAKKTETKFCKEHTSGEYKEGSLCIEYDCEKYAFYGCGRASYCKEHKSDGMWIVKSRKYCVYSECICRPTFYNEDRSLRFCKAHNIDNYPSCKKSCFKTGCTSKLSYGYIINKPLACPIHKLHDMKYVMHHYKCSIKCCNRRGYTFSGDDVYCKQHIRLFKKTIVDKTK